MTNEDLFKKFKKENDELKKSLENRDELLMLLTKEIAQLKINLNEKIEKIDSKLDIVLENK